mgnify:CR=1 FL=1
MLPDTPRPMVKVVMCCHLPMSPSVVSVPGAKTLLAETSAPLKPVVPVGRKSVL